MNRTIETLKRIARAFNYLDSNRQGLCNVGSELDDLDALIAELEAQEPVAWTNDGGEFVAEHYRKIANCLPFDDMYPLYTTPQQCSRCAELEYTIAQQAEKIRELEAK